MCLDRKFIVSALALVFASSVFAQKPTAPALSSRPGAQYTLYLNFCGFSYPGTWAGATPGTVPAYDTDGIGSSFSAGELQVIRNTWARFANAFQGFNVNITTVDPSPAAFSDAEKKVWYDQKQYFGNQILGGSNAWYDAGAGGVSYVGTAQEANVFSGRHTNWVFPPNVGNSSKGMAAAGIHEDGHIMGLPHQRDESNGGGYSNNNDASGNGSYAPIMGTTYVTQRGTWRQGSAFGNVNDVAVLQQNLNIGPLLDDGRGHSFGAATPIAVNAGGFVDVNNLINKGHIMPKASANYTAVGRDNYTKDYFKFRTDGGAVSLTVNDGNDLLNPGTADPGATMRSVMNIYTSAGAFIGSAVESSSTLTHTFSGVLSQGDYVAEIMSYGEYISAYEPGARYFNMGGYFLTGSNLRAVPEPGTMVALGLGVVALLRRRRRSA